MAIATWRGIVLRNVDIGRLAKRSQTANVKKPRAIAEVTMHSIEWGDRRGSNPRQLESQSRTLPLSYGRH